MSDNETIWETFDSLFKTVNRQARLVEELETRVVDLEQRLKERAAQQQQQSQASQGLSAVAEMPAERAA